ncbi:unnamed protein product [Lactuca saligna]|uniref:Uncharacterized protein n=1 Tax=Lactuca saligna TaxID=75948 RepID=A0AA35ZMN8_LACSI|nr:unnamed protein product [Lactuca saligna]
MKQISGKLVNVEVIVKQCKAIIGLYWPHDDSKHVQSTKLSSQTIHRFRLFRYVLFASIFLLNSVESKKENSGFKIPTTSSRSAANVLVSLSIEDGRLEAIHLVSIGLRSVCTLDFT